MSTESTTKATIEELKQMRSSTKGSITRIKNLVETKANSLSATELECRLGILESYFKQVLAYQTQIERLIPSDTNRGELEDLYIAAKTKIQSLLGTTRSIGMETSFVVPPPQYNNLPNLKLPKFNGRYSDYKNFMNSFTKLVDDETNLTKIQKFNHLLSCLSEQALTTVKAFQVSDENYPKALARLKERYDNDFLIFAQYISELFELPMITKASAVDLRALIDNVSAIFNSLQSIGSFENICNAMIIHIAMSKVDPETLSKWDEHQDYKKLPSWIDCSAVLSKRCQYLETRDTNQLRTKCARRTLNKVKPSGSAHRSQTSLTVAKRSCLFCGDTSHSILNCHNFGKLGVMQRFSNAKKLGLCLNCLAKGHTVSKCPSPFRCKVCKQSHHSLLHRSQQEENVSTSGEPSTSAAVHTALEKGTLAEAQVILATAVILVMDSTGSFQMGRALLDSGSQVNLITERFARSLHLRRSRRSVDIVGVGVAETKINFQTQTTIRSRHSNFEVLLEFLITTSITGYHPHSNISVAPWNLPKNLDLADEHFYHSSRIDLLLGAETFFDLLKGGQIKLGEGLPSLQNTTLGWIVSGRYQAQSDKDRKQCLLTTGEDSLDRYVERFWELEELQESKSKCTEEQKECEAHFNENLEISSTGRLMVKLPFKQEPSCLGASYNIAFRRFLALERRLAKNESIKQQYAYFLEEYKELGHMSLVKDPKLNGPHYYLPHHCVLKPGSLSTKLRVVFNASCYTSSQISLNDILMVGPTIQPELFTILLRFRLHRFVLTADIVKMYRQFLVHPTRRKFQYILWRTRETEPIQTYELNTVSYGTTSAPFLAIRCLKYLADKHRSSSPLGSCALAEDFYVDDFITGDDNLDKLVQKLEEVTSILKSAGIELSKWNSNHPNIDKAVPDTKIKLSESGLTSTLGISWNSVSDHFIFSYAPTKTFSKQTKKSVLSILSSLFDPLGLLSPIIIKGKIILQKLWIERVEWDASLPQSIETEWERFLTDLYSVQKVSVPRFVLMGNRRSYQIHGFADASMHAYGCCIYLRSVDEFGSTQVRLLVSKSRVAPINRKSLPRLELCAAHLLSKLWKKIETIFKDRQSEVYFWTDSAIVLHWIATHSSKLTTFVGNRIAEIQTKTRGVLWRHVPTQENPADIVSRGCDIHELKGSIWFDGPRFLMESDENWPSKIEIPLSPEEISLEKRKTVLICKRTIPNLIHGIVERFSAYSKIIRIIAYVIRFCRRFEEKWSRNMKKRSNMKDFPEDPEPFLTPAELNNALLHIVYAIQKDSFAEEIDAIKTFQPLKGSIKWLNPFLQETSGLSLLKVGGRLKHADIPEACKYPLLLPKNHIFAKILVRHIHLSNYHAGPKALVALIRQRFWIINTRELARQIVRQCIHCVRYRPKLLEQIMGDLPQQRVTPSRPFLCCGVDFCGPILTYLKIRGKVPYKSYVAVFICFSSKAVHLEAVSDLSAEAFIAALKRMIGRRGLPSSIYSDNATNFVGSQSKLKQLRNMFFKKCSQEILQNFCTNLGINFNFIPPRAPHFGGIWEAAMKVAKGHLYRSLGGAKLTFEELSTALVEIEAVMNSRPITPMSSDPNDLEALTPAHLLIGSSLKTIIEPAIEVPEISYIERWQRINAVKTHFWRRWSLEYLHELQGRGKWSSPSNNLKIGDLVLIHEDNVPPQRWLMGRVAAVIKGADGQVRVADVKTAKAVIRRAIRKLAPLPS